ncbi:laforin-like [Corvus moneduloides]|uniref:laforin-like n=2 Tax=Corvus TaxID=30420 RepID=UPI0013634C3E|nr:laforin-like [Corvus moneduloides]
MCMIPRGCCPPDHAISAEASRGCRASSARGERPERGDVSPPPRTSGASSGPRRRARTRARTRTRTRAGSVSRVSPAAPGPPAFLEGRRGGRSGGSGGGERRARAGLPRFAFSAGQRPLPCGHPPVPQAGEARSPLSAPGAGGSGRAALRAWISQPASTAGTRAFPLDSSAPP